MILSGNFNGRHHLEDLSVYRMILNETCINRMNNFYLGDDRDQWWYFENTVINLEFNESRVISLIAEQLLYSQEQTCFLKSVVSTSGDCTWTL